MVLLRSSKTVASVLDVPVREAVSRRIQDILVSAERVPEPADGDDASSSSDEETKAKSTDVRGKRPGNRFWKKDRKR